MKMLKSNKICSRCLSVLGAAAFGIVAGCATPSTDAAFAKYDDAKEIEISLLLHDSKSGALSTFLTSSHTYHRSPISHAPSCTPTPQASHTRFRRSSYTSTHTCTSPTCTYSLKPSDIWFHTPIRYITPSHTHLPCGWAITPSHTPEIHFALLRHMVQTQTLHPETKQNKHLLGVKRKCPKRFILSPSESHRLFP